MRVRALTTAAIAILASCAEQETVSAGSQQAPKAMSRPEIQPAPDAAALPQDLREGETTPVQAVSAYLRRIELLDDTGPRLQAVIAKNPEAVAVARRLGEKRASDEALGVLYGLPILVKDNIDTREMPTTAGSLALEKNVPARDAPAVARLREADAIILGKTNLSEWANFRSSESISGWSAVGGLTRNPHDLSRNACGSSSGSGAAVAAGLAWGALGTETNGSVTCPAAMNGIVGFKPTVGMIPRTGVVPISPSQDTIGTMTRTVRGAALMMEAMAGTDPEDEATEEADERKPDFLQAVEAASLEGVRLGVLRWAESDDPRENGVFQDALGLAEKAGAILVDIEEADLKVSGEDAFLVLKAEFKDSVNAYLEDTAEGVTTRTLDELLTFNRENRRELSLFGQDIFVDSAATGGVEDEAYLEAKGRLQKAAREDGMDRLLSENNVDFLVAPTYGPAFLIDVVRGDVLGGSVGAGWLAAIAGYPHLTLPMGDVSGLPLGFSVMGPKWSDAEILAAGAALEAFFPEPPTPSFRGHAEDEELFATAIRPAN